jgi:lysophospholipase L1-like esterase
MRLAFTSAVLLAAGPAGATEVWILGDSNSVGLYRSLVGATRARAVADPSWTVVDLAVPWTPSSRGVDLARQALATRPAPDVAVVCYGAVDAIYQFGRARYDGRRLTVAGAIRNLEKIRRMFRRVGTTVVLAQGVGVGPPQTPMTARERALARFLAAAYRRIGRAIRRRRPTMSFHVAASPYFWKPDRIHLNDTGYAVVARRVARVVRSLARQRAHGGSAAGPAPAG